MQGLAGVLLQMQPLDPHLEGRAVVALHHQHPLADDRVLELADLIALGQIGIEIVLAVEAGHQIDLGPESKARPDRLLDAETVDHRQHPRKTRIHEADLLVRGRTEADACAGEQLGLGGDLRMDLEAKDKFPLAGAAGDAVGGAVCHGSVLLRIVSSDAPLRPASPVLWLRIIWGRGNSMATPRL